MRLSFLHHDHPLLTAMIQTTNPNDCLATVKNAIYDGADAFGLQLCQMDPQYRTKEIYRSIFSLMGERPVYITNYRTAFNEKSTDDQLVQGLLEALEAGATLADIMGDLYDPSPLQMTENSTAILKQKQLIDRIHSMGKEVLMSCHIYHFLPAEQVLAIAKEQQSRGADIVKIVTGASSEEEEIENLRITILLKKELSVPFLFLSTGSHYKLHRVVGPMLGCAMILCVQQHDVLSSKAQPVLRSVREIYNNFDYRPDRHL